MSFDSILSRIKIISVIVMCGFISFAAWELQCALATAQHQILAVNATALNQSIANLSADEQDIAKLLPEATKTISSLNATVNHLNENNGVIDQAESTVANLNATVTDTHTWLTKDNGILDNANGAAKDFRVNLVQVSRAQTKYYTEDAPALTAFINNANALISDPDIKTAITNLSASSRNIADGTAVMVDIAKHADEMEVDFQGSLHSHLHPTRMALFLSGLWQVAKIAATHVP